MSEVAHDNPPEKTAEEHIPVEHPEDCKCNKEMEIETDSSWTAQKSILWQALPLILLLIISLLVKNILQIFIFIALILCFDAVNDFIVKQTENGRKLSVVKVGVTIFYLAGCICLSYPMVRKHWLTMLGNLSGWWSVENGFWSSILLITTADFLFKYFTVLIKSFILLFSGRIISFENQGRVYMFFEGLSQIFRCLLPIPEWSKYILGSEACVYKVICWILVVFYLFVKFKALKKKMPILINAYKYRTMTGSKLLAAGSEDICSLEGEKLCPICHGCFIEPVALTCKHVYCSGCIHQWFNRERHCPKCGSDAVNLMVIGIQTDPLSLMQYTSNNNKWKTGRTDFVIQFF